MLSTVHAYLNHKRNERGMTLGRIEAIIDQNHPELSMSDSKLSKIFKDPNYKLSMEELFIIVEAMGLDKREILSILGEQEYRASEEVDYKGAAELIPEFRHQMDALREQFRKENDNLTAYYKAQLEKEAIMRQNIHEAFTDVKTGFNQAVATLQKNHEAALAKRDDTFERSVAHLKTQLQELREDNQSLLVRVSTAEAAREQLDKRRHNVFWGMLAALITVLGLFILFIIIDAPQIGAGW